jgi:transposase
MGSPPVIHYSYRHDRISAIAALSVSAIRCRLGLYVSFQAENFKATHVARFLRHLLRHLCGHIMLLWDQGPIHKGPAIAEVLRDHQRLHLEFFPGYAPELNPVEQVWCNFKRRSANSLFTNRAQVGASLESSAHLARSSQCRLRSFIRASGLPSAPWS